MGLVVEGSSEGRGAWQAKRILGAVAGPTHPKQHHSVGVTVSP